MTTGPTLTVAEVPPEPDDDGAARFGVVAREVRRTFDLVVAVDRMDLRVPPGRVTALVGPNGSGKTTLMLMMAGLLAPDSGHLTVAGASPVARPSAVHAAVGWMPDVLGQWETLTCREVLTTFADAYGVPADQGRARAAELLRDVHLSELADAPARVLSRGQKQRLGLARALVHDPQVLLLDEPSSGIAQRETEALGPLLQDIRRATGCAMLVIEHDMPLITGLSDSIVALELGRVVLQGTPDEVLADPRVVSSYLGGDVATIQRSGGAAPPEPVRPRRRAKATAGSRA
jgi:ABC-2 type transport system ATP-binding protein